MHNAHGLRTDFWVTRRQGSVPVQPGRNVGDDQSGIFNVAAQRAHCCVPGVHLEPRYVAEPELYAVVSRFLDELEPLLETPAFWNHVVADGFFHGASLVSDVWFALA